MIKTLLRATGIGATIGAVAALGVYLLGRATGEEFVVPALGASEAAPLPWFAFLLAVVVQGGVGGFVVAVLATLTPWPRRAFVGATTLGLILSFISPFASAESTATAVWLSLSHVAAFAGVVPVLAGALPAARGGRATEGQASSASAAS